MDKIQDKIENLLNAPGNVVKVDNNTLKGYGLKGKFSKYQLPVRLDSTTGTGKIGALTQLLFQPRVSHYPCVLSPINYTHWMSIQR